MRTSSRSIAFAVLLGAVATALVALEGLEARTTTPHPLAHPPTEGAALAAVELDELERPAVEPPRTKARAQLDRSDPRFRPRADESAVGGWIETDAGAPAAHATAVLLDTRGNVLAEARADANGVFYARAKASGAQRVVALHPGCLPRCVEVELVLGSALELAPIALASGATIHGRVASEHEPIARAEVEARPTERGRTIVLQAGTIVAREDGFAWARVTAESHPDGSYTLRGLSNEPHRVSISVLRGRENALDLARVRSRVTTVPASGVDFALPAARLEIAVRSAGEPLAGVEVQINAGGQHVTRVSDENGLVALRISPAIAYPLVASRDGYGTTRAQLRGLIDGEVRRETLDLALQEPELLRSTWIVEVQGSASGEDAHFLFRRLDAHAAAERTPFTRRVARSLGGERFRIGELAPGKYEVTISSGGPARASTSSNRIYGGRVNCDAITTIDLLPGQTSTSTVSTIPLAILEVEARAADGTSLWPTVHLRDVGGDRETSEPQAHTGGPFRLSSDAIVTSDPNAVAIGHCGGVFELHVEVDGYHPLVETLHLEGTTRQRVALVLTHR